MATRTKSQKMQYDNNYIKEHYDRVNVLLPKGMKQYLSAFAAEKEISLSQLFLRATLEYFFHEYNDILEPDSTGVPDSVLRSMLVEHFRTFVQEGEEQGE